MKGFIEVTREIARASDLRFFNYSTLIAVADISYVQENKIVLRSRRDDDPNKTIHCTEPYEEIVEKIEEAAE